MMTTNEEYRGARCEFDGKKFPHYGVQMSLTVTKWFCNKGCYAQWKHGKPEQKEAFRLP
jgi:hypothetical protein